jgi:hypothetical protein
LSYLNGLKNSLRIDPVAKDDLIREISGHLEDKISELRETGMSELEATETATQLLGSPQVIAKQIYEVYSQGSWKQTIFAIIPHFFTAALFALHWWTDPLLLTIILFGVVGTVIYGWRHGKPTWLFSWLGFLLVPVMLAGVMLIYLPGDLAWVSAIIYAPLAIFIFIVVARQILTIDWLFVSLMILPIPIVIGWLIVLNTSNIFLRSERLSETAGLISLSFAVVGLAIATFIRVKQRWMKVGALLICSILVLTVLNSVSVNSLNFWTCLFLSVLMLLELFLPAFLEHRQSSDS